MKRYLSVYLPMWSINLVERKCTHPHKGILLVSKIGNQRLVQRACNASLKAGVYEGATLAFAKVVAPEVLVQQFDPVGDFKSLYKLALWFYRLVSPYVGIDLQAIEAFRSKQGVHTLSKLYYGLIVDITGTNKLHKSEEALIQRILSGFKKVNTICSLAIAPTIGASWALSRFGSGLFHITSQSELRNVLSPLPIQSLRLPDDCVKALNDTGIYTVAELLKLPPESLPNRFGPLLTTRLNQAFGHQSETFVTIQPRPPPLITKLFDPPLSNYETIQEQIHCAIGELMKLLHNDKRKGNSFQLALEEVMPSGTVFKKTKEISLHAPTNNLRELSRIVESILESLRVSGHIRRITLGVTHSSQAIDTQTEFIERSPSSTQESSIAELLNTFVVRLGKDQVTGVGFQASHIPERSFVHRSLADLRPLASNAPAELPLAASRPPYILNYPEPAGVISMLPDKPPSWIQWKGKKHKVLRGIGPERIGAEWWHTPLSPLPPSRDYFKILDDSGRWLWVFRESSTQRWFVQGVWV